MSYVEQESGYLCFEIQEYQELDSQMPGRMRDWSLYYRDPVCEETSAYDCSPLDQNPYYNGTDNNQDSISDLRVLEPAVHGDPSTALGFSPRTIFSEDHTTLFEGLGDEERGTDTSSIDSMIWKLPGVDSEPGSASGASRPSTPALSFSSSRYSSRPPSTYSLCDSSSIIDHITYVDPFPHCPETEVSPSYGSEAFVENVYSASLIGDRCGIDIYSHLFSPASNIPFDIDTYSSDCVNTLSSGLLIHPASHQGNLDYIVSECRSSPLSPCSSSLPLPSRDVNWSDYSSNDDNHQRTATYQTPRNELPTRPKPKRIRGRKPMCQDSDHDYEDLDDGENDESYYPVGSTAGKKRKSPYASETIGERSCNQCGMVFTRSADISRHNMAVHSEMSEEMKQESTCVLCLKVLARPDARKRHQETRTKRCMLEARRRVERGELDPEVYLLHMP